MIAVLETTNLFQNGGATHGEDQGGSGWREEGTLEGGREGGETGRRGTIKKRM